MENNNNINNGLNPALIGGNSREDALELSDDADNSQHNASSAAEHEFRNEQNNAEVANEENNADQNNNGNEYIEQDDNSDGNESLISMNGIKAWAIIAGAVSGYLVNNPYILPKYVRPAPYDPEKDDSPPLPTCALKKGHKNMLAMLVGLDENGLGQYFYMEKYEAELNKLKAGSEYPTVMQHYVLQGIYEDIDKTVDKEAKEIENDFE